MDREQLGYQRHDHCFSWMEDYQRAQQLLEEQWKGNWPQGLDAIAQQLNPLHCGELSELGNELLLELPPE